MIASASSLTAILVAWLWAGFVAPTIARGFDVPMASGWRISRRNQYLSKLQYVWTCGVFAAGWVFGVLTAPQHEMSDFPLR